MAVEIRFCDGAAGLRVKKRIFSAPEGRSSKNSDFFLRWRVGRQKTVTFFCAAGLHVPKIMDFFCAAGLHVQK